MNGRLVRWGVTLGLAGVISTAYVWSIASRGMLAAGSFSRQPAAVPGRMNFEAKEARYALTYAEQGRARLVGRQAGGLRVKGTLCIATLARAGQAGTETRLFRVPNPRVTGDLIESAPYARALEGGCVVEMRGGMAQSIAFPPGTPAAGRNLWRGWLHFFQFDPAVRAGSAAHVAEQRDLVGNAFMKYVRQPTPAAGGTTVHVRRLLLGYRLPPRSPGCKSVPAPVSRGGGAVDYGFQKDGALHRLSGGLVVETVLLPDMQVVGQISALLDLRRSASPVEHADSTAALQVVASSFVRAEPFAPDTDTDTRQAGLRAALRGFTIERLLGEAGALDGNGRPAAGGAGAKAEQDVYSRLTAQLELERAGEVDASARFASASGWSMTRPSVALVMAALASRAAAEDSSRASAPAQEALRSALRQSSDSEDRARIAALLADVERPSAGLVGELAALADNGDARVRSAARLTLGCLSHNLVVAGRRSEGNAVASFLLRLYQSARADEDRRTAVLALGNAGWSGSVPLLLRLSRSGGDLRLPALYALRFVGEPRVTGFLLAALRDRDLPARLEAARALLFRPLELRQLKTLTVLARAERNADVRRLLQENIALEQPYHRREPLSGGLLKRS